MRVDIDKTRSNELARRVEGFRCISGRNAGIHRCNLATADRNVHHAIEPLARVENSASFDHEVILWRSLKGNTTSEDRRGHEKLSSIHHARRL
jgi:hypothetical protein